MHRHSTFHFFARCLLIVLLSFVYGSGASLENAAMTAQSRLEAALAELSQERAAIQVERVPLVRELNQLESRLEQLELEWRELRRSDEGLASERDVLRKAVSVQRQDREAVQRNLLPRYFAEYEAALSAGERQHEGERIRAYNRARSSGSGKTTSGIVQGLELVLESLDQIESNLGGRGYSGKALAPDGMMIEGHFLQLGPMLYFADIEGELSGVVTTNAGLNPQVNVLRNSSNGSIRSTIARSEGPLPMDFSLGDAIRIASTQSTLGEHLAKGGVWVYPILLFALVSAFVAVLKSIQIFSIRHPRPTVLHDLVKAMREGDLGLAKSIATEQPQPTQDMLVAAVEHADESTEMVEEVMYESMLTTQPRLERFLNVIAVTAAAAPLLGLLGTVTGIIKTFQLMSVFGAGDPKPLISGISEALITTELGLILAIPALVLHAVLARKVSGTMARLEKSAITLVNGLARRTSTAKEASVV